jgi:signal transduction histidine kinase
VSHTMSAIAIRAGVANHVADEEPAEARHALGDIEAISRTALTELRQMLGLLRTGAGEPSAALAPVPDLGDLDRLVAEVSRSGVQVDLRITGDPRPMPPGVGLSAYRILQESLTNVVKHAGAVQAAVTLGYRPYEVWIEVVDDGRRAPAAGPPGHGLIGMRERVSLYGGQFSAGPLRDRGFRVSATIPLGEGER